MNGLSWFIYLVQLADAATTVFIVVGVTSVVVYAAKWAYAGIGADTAASHARIFDNSSYAESRKIGREVLEARAPKLTPHLAVFLACVAIAAVIPSRQTLILIAGSEMGERAIKSDAVQSVVNPGMDLVKTWIKQETERLKKGAEK